ncbi:sterol desaturase [Achlya hypogyna]|uniref:Sterol desaturase n=1 Tax=Achlya hypogyna TaxID=1202772 RepID=A0A1V9YQH7_ACHHY|nr:sterol desaturase [Achlya hypogyna]
MALTLVLWSVNAVAVVGVCMAATQWHATSTASFLVVFLGYIGSSILLERLFYPAPSPRAQPKAADHNALALFNLLVASVFAMATAECHARGLSRMSFGPAPSTAMLLLQVLGACVFENTIEYYWHRILHTRAMYTRIHKVHHHYKRPRPFDDMYMHPCEGMAYYWVLYGPPFVLPMHLHSFVVYMVLMGTFGLLDHSGVPVRIPFVYDTRDHDVHHTRVTYNYGFPFQLLDVVHGTYLPPKVLD